MSTISIYRRVIILNIFFHVFPSYKYYMYTCNIIHKSTWSFWLYLCGSLHPKKCTLPGTLRAELRRGEARWMHGGKCDDFVEWLFVNGPTNYLHQKKTTRNGLLTGYEPPACPSKKGLIFSTISCGGSFEGLVQIPMICWMWCPIPCRINGFITWYIYPAWSLLIFANGWNMDWWILWCFSKNNTWIFFRVDFEWFLHNLNKAYNKVIALFLLFNDRLTCRAQCFGCSSNWYMAKPNSSTENGP